MMRLVIVTALILGSLAGSAEAQTMNGEAAGRFSLEVVGFLVTGFLFYLAFSGALRALLSRTWRPKRRVGAHRGLTSLADGALRPSSEVHDVRHKRGRAREE